MKLTALLTLAVLALFACSAPPEAPNDPQPEQTGQTSDDLTGHHCVLNGMYICPTGEHFSTRVCHCVK
jgi:hypothetical protein